MSKIKLNKKIYLLLLLIICLSGFVINATYAKFTEGYTTSESIADLNYNFNITTNIEEYEMVTISSDDFKVINVDITNNNAETNYYGVWYNLLEPSTENNITIAKVETSANDTSGSIDTGTTKTVTVIIKNNTDTDIKLKVGVGSSTTSTSDITYTGNNKLITETSPQPILLSTVTAGSYVKYVGDNGCSGASCMGQNANYVSDTDMGYCRASSYKYTSNGWRVAYVDAETPYLISGGAPECISTDANGKVNSTLLDTSNREATEGLPQHLNNLNAHSLYYCNSQYVSDETCSINNSRSINDEDFQVISNNQSTLNSCYGTLSTEACGLNNSLIDIYGLYWFAKAYESLLDSAYMYSGNGGGTIQNHYTYFNEGLRPVIKLKPDTYAMSGTGTYADPYVIEDDDIVTLISGTTITKKAGSTNATTNSTINHNKTKEYLYLDGIDDYINLGLENQTFPNGATIITKVRMKNAENNDSYPEYSILRNSETGGTGLYVTNNEFAYQIYNESLSGYYIVYSKKFSLNKWYTVVGTYDNNELKIYVDGILEGTEASVGTIKAVSVPLAIGVNPGPSAEYYAGYGNFDISDAFIYDKALTAEEISTYFSNKITDYPTNNLLSYFHFDAESIG